MTGLLGDRERPLVRTFSYHYRHKYGLPVGKIPLDSGVSCPNRRQGGCVFCRPASFTPSYLQAKDSVDSQIAKGKKQFLGSRFSYYLAYFQQESCTYLPVDELLAMVERVLAAPECLGVILSTRPDLVPLSLLEQLSALITDTGKECLFELGLQSVHEGSLKLLNRNHTVQDFVESAEKIKSFGHFQLGAHLIFGIPGESPEDMLESVRMVSRLGVDAVKLHHLQVVRDTELARWYADGNLRLFSLEEYLDLLLKILVLIPAHVAVHRLWTTSHPDLLIAPRWNVLAADLSKMLQTRLAAANLWQGKNAAKVV